MERWNNSKLMDLLLCGEHHRRRYLDEDVRPSTLPQTRGSVVHSVARIANMRQHDAVKAGQLPAVLMSSEEAKDTAATLFDQQVEFTYEPKPGDPPLKVARTRARALAIKLADHYATRVAPKLVPVAVETLVEVQPKGTDLIVHGTPDLVTLELDKTKALYMDPPPLIEVIRDAKTGVRPPRSNVAHDSQQLTFYGMLRQSQTGKLPTAYVLDYVVGSDALASSPARHIEMRTWRRPEDVGALVQRLNAAIESVRKGVFLPAAPGSWRCSASWCEFWTSCRFVNHTPDNNADQE